MVNNPELIEQTINNIKKLSKEDLDKVMKEADEWYNKEKINNITQRLNNKIQELKNDKDSYYYDNFLEERDIEKTIEILEESKGEYKNE